MLRSIAIPRPDRRHMVVLVSVAAAVLVALAVTLEPAGSPAGGSGVDGAPAPSAVGEPHSGSAKVEGEVMPAVGGIGIEEDASIDFAAREAAGGAADTVETAPGGGAALAPPSLDAKIVRTASIAIEVPRRGFEDAWGDAQAVATSTGGYIVGATRSGAGDSGRSGTITMRVPTGRFEAALERLRGIDDADVGRLDVSSQDVTQEYVDVKSRLRHDRAVEGRLLALLADAEGVSEVLAVQARLDSVQEQIEVARGRLNYLDKLTAMSTIEVSLAAPAKGRTTSSGDKPGALAEAFDEARDRFVGNVAGAVVWAGGALPTLLFLAFVALAGRFAWRRHARRGDDSRVLAGEKRVES